MTGFKGYYFKHQKDVQIASVIVGTSSENAFIQVIFCDRAYKVFYPIDKFIETPDRIELGASRFSGKGILLNITTESGILIRAAFKYGPLASPKRDVMGFLRYFPMQCRHNVYSLYQTVDGYINVDGTTYDFSNGRGYIEGDEGSCFPKKYRWLHSGDFAERSSLLVSIAYIPLLGRCFLGSLAVLCLDGEQKRFATYLGARVINNSPNRITLSQGKFELDIGILPDSGIELAAPDKGLMTRTIAECPSCFMRFRLYRSGTLLFEGQSRATSYESDPAAWKTRSLARSR